MNIARRKGQFGFLQCTDFRSELHRQLRNIIIWRLPGDGHGQGLGGSEVSYDARHTDEILDLPDS